MCGNKKISCRVSFFGDPTDNLEEVDTFGSQKTTSVRLIQSSRSNDRRSPSFVVKRKRPPRSFQDGRAEKIRKELQEEERKWEKFLEEPVQPEEIMKYMTYPVPTELTGSKITRERTGGVS